MFCTGKKGRPAEAAPLILRFARAAPGLAGRNKAPTEASALIINPRLLSLGVKARKWRGFPSPVIGSPPEEPEKPRVYPPSPGLLHIRPAAKRPRPSSFCNSMGFIPFIVAPLLPRLCRPVDGEIRAKNSGGTVVKARNSGRAFILCRSTLQLAETPSKPDRPSPSSSETLQSCNVLVGHVAGVTPTSSPTSDCSPRILAAARRSVDLG